MNRQTDYAAATRTGTITCTFDDETRAHDYADDRGLIVLRRTVTFEQVRRRVITRGYGGRFVADGAAQ